MNMKIIICDNNVNIIHQISDYLNIITELRKISFNITSCSCGEDIIHKNEKYDIAFIEIELPGIDGLTVTKHLQNVNPNIMVFIVTSTYLYLDDAMDLNVFRYLSKPIDKNRFIKNINKAIDIYQQETQIIPVETSHEIYSLFTKDILYITIENRKACIITKEGKLRTQNNFDYWKQLTSKYEYLVQSHYSFIVNLRNVVSFSKTEITLTYDEKNCKYVPISRRFYSSFKESFQKYIEFNKSV